MDAQCSGTDIIQVSYSVPIRVFLTECSNDYLLIKELSWPEMGIEAAKKAIGGGPFPAHAFKETAEKVRKAFEEHGSQRYARKGIDSYTRFLNKLIANRVSQSDS